MNENIVTCLRIKENTVKPAFSPKQININNKTFAVDNIFYGPNQDEMFNFISKTILAKCVEGYNCTVFAYGQTGSGKTYTIQGTENSPGLIQRSLSFFHNNYEQIKLSFIEIYNENMLDLSNPQNEISVREDPVNGVTVDSLNVFSSKSLESSLDFYKKGISNRKTAATQMNENSSRSHSIFTVYLEMKSKSIIKRSKLCFVDLAGSEKIGDNESERVKEACNINKSLLCLGKIVQKLGSNDKWHISYRDSKLTFLLKDSLGGNSKLAIIGTVNVDYPSDTINTLNFLNRSKMISNSPSINYYTEQSTIEELTDTIRQLDEENSKLKSELAKIQAQSNNTIKSSIIYDVKKLKSGIETLKREFLNIRSTVDMLINNYYDSNYNNILEINENLKIISEQCKENFKNLFNKKRRLNEE